MGLLTHQCYMKLLNFLDLYMPLPSRYLYGGKSSKIRIQNISYEIPYMRGLFSV